MSIHIGWLLFGRHPSTIPMTTVFFMSIHIGWLLFWRYSSVNPVATISLLSSHWLTVAPTPSLCHVRGHCLLVVSTLLLTFNERHPSTVLEAIVSCQYTLACVCTFAVPRPYQRPLSLSGRCILANSCTASSLYHCTISSS